MVGRLKKCYHLKNTVIMEISVYRVDIVKQCNTIIEDLYNTPYNILNAQIACSNRHWQGIV